MKNRLRYITRQIQLPQGGREEKEGTVMGQPQDIHNYLAENTKPPYCRGVSLARFGGLVPLVHSQFCEFRIPELL